MLNSDSNLGAVEVKREDTEYKIQIYGFKTTQCFSYSLTRSERDPLRPNRIRPTLQPVYLRDLQCTVRQFDSSPIQPSGRHAAALGACYAWGVSLLSSTQMIDTIVPIASMVSDSLHNLLQIQQLTFAPM